MEHHKSAKWPVVLDRFIESGEQAYIIEVPDDVRGHYIVKALNTRYHANDRGVMALKRGKSVVLVNAVTATRVVLNGGDAR